MAMKPHKEKSGWDGSIQRLDPAERWMTDGLRVADGAGLFVSEEVDMSQARAAITRLRDSGVKATYTHVFVRAAAIALARHPELHYLVVGSKRYLPNRVDIGLSVSGSSVVAPVLVIEQAESKSLRQIAQEIIEAAPQAREENERMLDGLRRRSWLTLFGWLRRSIVRGLLRNFSFRHKDVGTFQVSCLKDVDQFAPLLLTAGAILGTGRVRDRVVAINGTPDVRPTVIISCCADHKVWDGVRAASFIQEFKAVLESDHLESEL